MSLFHEFQDVYFDAVRLADALEQIPQVCDCCDGEAHLACQCNCVAARMVKASNEIEQGYLYHLEKLRGSLYWLEQDLQRLIISQPTDGQLKELNDRLFWLMSCIRYLTATLARLGQALGPFRLSCTHEELFRLKECGQELRRWSDQLNALL